MRRGWRILWMHTVPSLRMWLDAHLLIVAVTPTEIAPSTHRAGCLVGTHLRNVYLTGLKIATSINYY